MKAVWACVLLSICMAIAVPLNEAEIEDTRQDARNPIVIAAITLLIESLRNTILNGSDDLPVLDPFIIDEPVHLDDEIIPIPGARMSLGDTTVKNLGAFIIDELTVVSSGLTNHRVTLEGHIPVIDIDCGFYDLFVEALGFNIFGSGTAKIDVVDPRITAELLVTVGIFTGINVLETTVHFSLGGFQSQITGMFGHDGASEFVSLFLNNLIPELVVMYENEISEVLSEIVHEVLQNAL